MGFFDDVMAFANEMNEVKQEFGAFGEEAMQSFQGVQEEVTGTVGSITDDITEVRDDVTQRIDDVKSQFSSRKIQ